MKYKSLASEVRWVQVGARVKRVEPGEIVEFPDDPTIYIQTGDQGETPLWEQVKASKSNAKGAK